MRRLYQTEWQGIPFSDFAKESSKRLAGPEFYQAFYETFFHRYRTWEDIAPPWRQGKEQWADFIRGRAGSASKVLAVGCGLGFIEHYVQPHDPSIELCIHEVAPAAWRWVEAEFAPERKFTGLIPDCLPPDSRFDLVYLATVDYALDDEALVGLLAAVRPFLTQPAGECLLISASFQHTPGTLAERARSAVRSLRTGIAVTLDLLGLRPRGQFWGWMRSREEYRSLMERAGYHHLDDGFIDPSNHAHYWIAGRD